MEENNEIESEFSNESNEKSEEIIYDGFETLKIKFIKEIFNIQK